MFGPDGYKLSDEDEAAIERLLEQPSRSWSRAEQIGRSRKIEDARGRYIHFAKSTFPEELRLDGLKIVVDCANGAAYQVAPSALWELGADVVAIGRLAQRPQHQRRLRLDRARGAAGAGGRGGRRISASRSTATPTG